MSRDEILRYIYDLNFVENYAKKLANTDDWYQIDDIISDLWLQICEIPEEKWDKLLSQGTKKDSFYAVRGFVSGLIYRNVKSKNSKLYYHLKKHWEKEMPISEVSANVLEDIADE